MTNNRSYLFLCFGRSYIDDCLDFVTTARHCQDNTPISIVVDPTDKDYALAKNVFSRVITFNVKEDELYHKCDSNFEKFCLLPRLRLPKFIHNQYTIVLDTDMLCAYNTEEIWSILIEKDSPVVMLGSTFNPSWHWGHWGEVCKKNNINPYETHGGLFFIDNTNIDLVLSVFNDARYAFENYDKLGMLKLYQGSAVDEPCFSYAFNKNNITPINFKDACGMTFNINQYQPIPTKLLTEKLQYGYLDKHIPFLHMFNENKNQSLNFKNVKQKILKHNYEQ